MKVFLKDRVVVDIFGDEDHPINKGSLCPKGLLVYRHLGNPDRIVHPQIRERIDKQFKRASWDEAISFTANKLLELARERGEDSLYIHGTESAPFSYLAGGALFAKQFGTVNAPHRFLPPQYGDDGLLKKMFGVRGDQLSMNSLRDWSNSRCILVYSSDTAATDPITFGHIVDARDRGTALIVIDSRNTVTASKAALSLRIKPGSGPVVLKGVVRFLIEQGFVDESRFMESNLGFPSLKAETEAFTPEMVARLSWIAENDFRKMAELIAKNRPLQIIAADWNSRGNISDEELSLCGAVVSLTGSVGIPGGGLNLLDVTPFPAGERSFDEEGALLTGPGRLPSLSLEQLLLMSPQIGCLIWQGNPSARLAQGRETKKALEKLPLIVHLSSYPNESFHFSHVSFPMSSWLEYSGLIANNNGRAVQWHHQVAEPPGECRAPLGFWKVLAEACGIREAIFFPERAADTAKAVDSLLQQNSLTRCISVKKIDPETNPPGGLLWPCVEESDLEFENSRFVKGDIRGRNILFQRGRFYPLTDKRFPTPSRKIVLNPRAEGTNKAKGLSLPEEADLPMILITGVLVDYLEEHGYFVSDRDAWTQDRIVQIHPQTGKVLGVESGQEVTIENDRGRITAPVWLTANTDPRVIWCPEGVDPYQPHFAVQSFRSLFEAPDGNNRQRSFTNVVVYKAGQDRIAAGKRLLNFFEQLKQEKEAVRR